MVSSNRRIVRCSADDVFAILGDGWLYPAWVVGATRMRAVDPEWPEQGSHIHHSLGVWPIMLDDQTEIVEWSPPHRVRLRAKAGPLGRGVVVLDVREHEQGCSIGMAEEPVSGPARFTPRVLWNPLLKARNRETLRRLAFLAEGRRVERHSDEQSAREEVPDPTEETASPQARVDAIEANEAVEEAASEAEEGLEAAAAGKSDHDEADSTQ